MSVIKTIKFDLPIDGVKFKTFDELKNHFTTEVIDLYKNGLLSRWLQSQGMNEYVQALSGLSPQSNDALLLSSLCEIFNVAIDDQELLSQLANHHTSGIKIDPEELKYKSKYEALMNESKPKGKIMGFDNEFIGPEISMEMLVKMHKHHTGEDIMLVPVWISDSDHDYGNVENFNPKYSKKIGEMVFYKEQLLISRTKEYSYSDKTLETVSYAPCDGVLYKKVRVNPDSLLSFYANSNRDGMLANLDPIIVAYLRIDM